MRVSVCQGYPTVIRHKVVSPELMFTQQQQRTHQVEFVYVCLHIDVCNNNNQRGEKAMGGAGRRKGKWRNDVIRFYLKFKSCQSENYIPQTFLLKW